MTVRELWWELKHNAEARQLFAEAVFCFTIATGIPTFFVLNYFFQWWKPT